ncbi:hypothetical protein BC833DRAFT_595358 [Globomyces pollinis-pini]|nr:hypothetical protein BC833DRAFT_595358 [Globomyces pollinis-pini]KAJ2996263.1 hypothetical protein HDV02_006660 [Globomyces sp. JEL0801]
MGREIVLPDEDWNECVPNATHCPMNVQSLIRQAKELSPTDLRIYFEKLFSRMTASSKEAMTEIMWRGLTPGEQQCFEMPYFGHRWSDNSINSALHQAFLSPTSEPDNTNRNTLRLSENVIHFSSGTTRQTVQGGATTRSTRSNSNELEDQFFAILRSAIMRSERSAASAVRNPPRNLSDFQDGSPTNSSLPE